VVSAAPVHAGLFTLTDPERPRSDKMTDSLTTLRLLEALIACCSVTPADAGCQPLIAARLEAQGFVCETMPFGPDQARVTHLGAWHRGASPGPTPGPGAVHAG